MTNPTVAEFLKDVAGTAGLVFVGCGVGESGAAQSTRAPARAAPVR